MELFEDFNLWNITINCNEFIPKDKHFSYLFSSADTFCKILNYYISKNECNI